MRVAAATTSTRERYDFSGAEVAIRPDPDLLDEGDEIPTLRYSELGFFFYAALGIVRHVELNLQTSGKRADLNGLDPMLRTTGLSDFGVGIKVGDDVGSFAFATELSAKIPTGYDDDVDPPLGDGQVDVETRAMGGASLWPLGVPGYAGLEIGYKHRGGAPMDEFVLRLEAGSNVFRDVGVRAKLDGHYARELPSTDETATDLFAFNSRVTKLTGTLWFEVERALFVELGLTRVLAARNVTTGSTWSAAIAHEFDFGPRR